MVEKDFLVAEFRQGAAATSTVLRQHPDQPAPTVAACPGWTVTDVVLHVGRIQRTIAALLTQPEGGPPPAFGQINPALLELPEPYLGWLTNPPAPTDRAVEPGLVDWFEQGATRLAATMEATDPAHPVPSFGGPSTAERWMKGMAIEMAIHGWDIQNAYGQARSIEPELAVTGLELNLGTLPMRRDRYKETARPGEGETYHFHRTDGPGEWLVRFDPDQTTISHEHAKGDIALRGTASDLLLFIWNRQDTTSLEVFGNRELAERYRELVPAV